MYQVYISDGANSEAVWVTGGTYTAAGGGTIILAAPFFSHSSYTVGSASSGIQETINLACGTSASLNFNRACNVFIPANGYTLNGSLNGDAFNEYYVYGTIYLHTYQSKLSGNGTFLYCQGRGPCLQVGDRISSNDFYNNTIDGIAFRIVNSLTYPGVAITNTVAGSGFKTITTASAHGFRSGDLVAIQFTDDSSYLGDAIVFDCGSGASPAACTGSSTTFRIVSGSTITTQATPGVVALEFSAVLDNAMHTHMPDLVQAAGTTGKFNNWFDIWDDENALIDHFSNNAIQMNQSATWNSSFLYVPANANAVTSNISPVITFSNSNITANYSSCVTDQADNGLYFENSVCQASGLWQANVRSTNQTMLYKNIYYESNAGQNPVVGAKTPYPIGGVGGLIAINTFSSGSVNIQGQSPVVAVPSGGTGSCSGPAFTCSYVYFVAVQTYAQAVGTVIWRRVHTSPMQILNWLTTGSDTPVLRWPRVVRTGKTRSLTTSSGRR